VEVVAKVQELSRQRCNREDDFRDELSREVEIMQTVRGERHCAQYIDFFIDEDLSYILMEKCECSLPSALEVTSPLTAPMLADCFRQMLAGLASLHSEQIIHRDIKPTNFLVNGTIGKDAVVKLCDFGSATFIPGEPGSSILLWDVSGTVQFSSPEMLSFRGYGKPTDIWSFGVLVYVLLFGQFPYMPRRLTAANLPKPTYKTSAGLTDAHLTPSMISFVEALLDRDPSERTTAHRALKMDWLRPAPRSKTVHASQKASLEQIVQSARRVGALGSDSRSTSKSGIDMKLLNL
jgi:serine/threonine protein kinase